MTSKEFIRSGQRWQCPSCRRLQVFERPILATMLPVVIRCSFADCKYAQSHSVLEVDNQPVFPKVDPINPVMGSWKVELNQAEVKPLREYWKPSTAQVSFNERCNTIATHIAGGLMAIETLKSDLDNLAESFTGQFQAEWSLATSFLKYWHPSKVNAFIKAPFCCLPVTCQDKFLTARTRIFFCPNFFTVKVGFPLQNFGGYTAQMVTPYTLINFPLESHLAKFMDLLPLPDVYTVGEMINGRDLYRCWRDIPGTVPDREHSDEAPLLRIKEPHLARPWLARLGINPWNIGELRKQEDAYAVMWSYFNQEKRFAKEREIFQAFVKWGRLALFFESATKAWEIAATIGGYMYGNKLALISSSQREQVYKTILTSCTEQRANTSFHWKEIRSVEDVPEAATLDSLSLIIVYYDDAFPAEALAALYKYQGRLIIVAHDPLMDTLSENWEASLLFGLVSQSLWYPEVAPSTAFNYQLESVKESPVGSLLKQWVESSNIYRKDQ